MHRDCGLRGHPKFNIPVSEQEKCPSLPARGSGASEVEETAGHRAGKPAAGLRVRPTDPQEDGVHPQSNKREKRGKKEN